MTKKFLTFGILTIILAGILVPQVVFGQSISSGFGPLGLILGESGVAGAAAKAAMSAALDPLFSFIGWVLSTISAMILIIAGWMFDGVVSYTVIGMAGKINDAKGIGGAINSSWTVLRDIANMCFIFVLLYAAFKAMFDSNFGNFGKMVMNIIIIALLINFSLFFSKVVIDASNIVSVGFYKAIANNSQDVGNIPGQPGATANFKGISGGYMRMLGMQTWYSSNVILDGLDAQKSLTVGIMSSIFMLITAVIFLMAGIMLAARFVILVFLLILSPLAFIAFAIPSMKGKFDEWLSSLVNQSFFAPLYFALTWVTFKLGNTLVKPKATWADLLKDPNKFVIANQQDTISLLLNFVLVIGFSIAALIFAKQMASKTKFFGAIAGGVGAATIGSAAWATRNTLGRGAANMASNKDLQERAARGDVGARIQLATAKKLAGSSFDVRGLGSTDWAKKIGADKYLGDVTDAAGKAGGAGGYSASTKTKDEKRRERTDDIIKRFRNQPEILADHLESLSPGDQKYMYDKLSARDRAAIDDALDTKHSTTGGSNPTTTRLRDSLSPEEKEKTEKAGKETIKEKKTKERIDEINKIATNPIYAATLAPTAIDTIIKGLPNSQARKLSSASRRSPLIIPLLTVRHLADLMSEGDLTTDEITDIKTNATPAQMTWMSDPVRKALWDIP